MILKRTLNNMSLIKILPENLINQIAAGEVIERPSSVVKELVENSLDAGAHNIVIELKNAGKSLIRITDDGCGMNRKDAGMAMQRHATSKISEEKDLWNIGTMGFRGEALASISSVSKFTLKTKSEKDLAGTEIYCEGGDIKSTGDVGVSKGTQIEVRDLFFNTPARQKYLKQDSTELKYVGYILNSIFLANPDVSFKYIHNGKEISDLPKVTDLKSRISDVFGVSTADAMFPIFYGGSDFQFDGFVGKPVISRSTSNHQYFFVNKRPIQHYILSNVIKQAFHSLLMEGKKPVFIVNINIDPSLIDVNVHPRKVEIRFEDQKSIVRTLYSSVKTALEKNDLTPKGFSESKRYMSDSFPQKQQSFTDHVDKNVIESAMNYHKSIADERDHGFLSKDEDKKKIIKSIFQIANSYIVTESEEGLILIDQHAAHERVRYEQLMDQFENQEKSIQPLLVPMEIDFTNDEVVIFEENLKIFENLGYEIEKIEGKYVVNGVPSFLSKEDIDGTVKGVLDDIADEKNPSKFQGKSEEIIHYMACRSAIKFGQTLQEDEMRALIAQMDKLKRPYTCPHGRPTMISLDLDELGKMFGRK